MSELPTNAEILAEVTGEKPKNIRRKSENGEVIALTEEQAARLQARMAERARAIANGSPSSRQAISLLTSLVRGKSPD
jgi:hypothetical protein